MHKSLSTLTEIGLLLLTAILLADPATAQEAKVSISFTEDLLDEAVNGRVVLLFSTNQESEPRFQVDARVTSAQVFGIDVEDWGPGEPAVIDASVFGYPIESLADIPSGQYVVQAVLHKYETFNLSTGHTVKLPMDRGEGQHWNRAPGNLYSTPTRLRVDPSSGETISVQLDQVIPPIPDPPETKYIKHVRIQSDLLTEFWGRPMHLGAHVLVPEGFEEHPEARYPIVINHGHFPYDFGGFRTEPPDEDIECEYSERFDVECYNRIQQQEAYDFYKTWTGDDFPRFLIVKIQHQNPYYDDSYAVNSANLGPYGDAIMYELLPYIEEIFRAIGEGWARFTYGGSTGGWEALAVQVFYPDAFNGTFAACPDPIDFRQYTLINIYEDENAYYKDGPFGRLKRPGHRDHLGRVQSTQESYNHMELALGTRNRSGDQYDIWEAVYSPMGDDGYPKRLWDKRTGEIDHEVAEHWRENYDLRYILERDWAELGPKLVGKLHIYVGDMDNYYLNNAVYLMEEFLESTSDPYYAGVVDYGDRAEHCWNGDHNNPNHISRLRYHTMYVPRILERIEAAAPEDADLTSWRY